MATVTPVPPLTLDETLATTRSVRKRLDLQRPVERAVLEECLALAQQAPTPSNMQNWQFLVITDPATRRPRRPLAARLRDLQDPAGGRHQPAVHRPGAPGHPGAR